MRALEVAESEIDSLENDLKRLNSEYAKPCQDVPSSKVLRPALPLIIYFPGVEKTYQPLGKDQSTLVDNAQSCDNIDVVVIENLEEHTVNGSVGGGHLIVALRSDIGESLCDGVLKPNKGSGIEL